MSRFSAKVTVDYYFDIDDDDIVDEKQAENYAWYNFQDYAYTAEIYDIEIEEDDDWEEDDDDSN